MGTSSSKSKNVGLRHYPSHHSKEGDSGEADNNLFGNDNSSDEEIEDLSIEHRDRYLVVRLNANGNKKIREWSIGMVTREWQRIGRHFRYKLGLNHMEYPFISQLGLHIRPDYHHPDHCGDDVWLHETIGIYVIIDSRGPKAYDSGGAWSEPKRVLHLLLNKEELAFLPVLVIAKNVNKQRSLPLEELRSLMGLDEIKCRKWKIMGSSSRHANWNAHTYGVPLVTDQYCADNWMRETTDQYYVDWNDAISKVPLCLTARDKRIEWCKTFLKHQYSVPDEQLLSLVRRYGSIHCGEWIPQCVTELIGQYFFDSDHVLKSNEMRTG